jgi:nucleotide-binding universal stress UspA family protein
VQTVATLAGQPLPAARASSERILVAYEAGERGARALDLAVRLSRAGASLVVLSVVPRSGRRLTASAWPDEERCMEDLRRAQELLRQRGQAAHFLLRAGELGAAIERAVNEGDFDTVVLGSAASAGSGAGYLSVSDHVASHTRATVILAA